VLQWWQERRIIREGIIPVFNKTSNSAVGQKNEPFVSVDENKNT
jgi:hypothetical protein